MNLTYNGVRPSNRSEALIWNHYNDPDKWDWIKIRYWPRCLAVAVMTKSLNYTTRWQLLVYLVGNGKHPDIAGDEVLEMGFSYFDEDAKRHNNNNKRLRDTTVNSCIFSQRAEIGLVRVLTAEVEQNHSLVNAQ